MVPPAPKTSTGGVYRSFSIADNNLVGLVFNLPLACGRTALSGLTKFYHSLTFLTWGSFWVTPQPSHHHRIHIPHPSFIAALPFLQFPPSCFLSPTKSQKGKLPNSWNHADTVLVSLPYATVLSRTWRLFCCVFWSPCRVQSSTSQNFRLCAHCRCMMHEPHL